VIQGSYIATLGTEERPVPVTADPPSSGCTPAAGGSAAAGAAVRAYPACWTLLRRVQLPGAQRFDQQAGAIVRLSLDGQCVGRKVARG
jgi:hypothetical protein